MIIDSDIVSVVANIVMDVQDSHNCTSDSTQERPPFSLVSSVTVVGDSNVGKTSLILSYIIILHT